MKKKSKDKYIEKLYDLMLKNFTRMLSSGEATAQELSVVRKFIESEGINMDFTSVKEDSAAAEFLDSLPFVDTDLY